jgi:hypothetical protein
MPVRRNTSPCTIIGTDQWPRQGCHPNSTTARDRIDVLRRARAYAPETYSQARRPTPRGLCPATAREGRGDTMAGGELAFAPPLTPRGTYMLPYTPMSVFPVHQKVKFVLQIDTLHTLILFNFILTSKIARALLRILHLLLSHACHKTFAAMASPLFLLTNNIVSHWLPFLEFPHTPSCSKTHRPTPCAT